MNLIELLITIAMLGVLLGMGAPRLASIREKGAVRSARDQVQGYLLTARASALRSGWPATFHLNAGAGSIWVTGRTATDTLANRRTLESEFGVTLSGSIDSVRFNSRGFATNLGGNRVIRVTRSGYTDSVCVSRLGTITRQCGF